MQKNAMVQTLSMSELDAVSGGAAVLYPIIRGPIIVPPCDPGGPGGPVGNPIIVIGSPIAGK